MLTQLKMWLVGALGTMDSGQEACVSEPYLIRVWAFDCDLPQCAELEENRLPAQKVRSSNPRLVKPIKLIFVVT